MRRLRLRGAARADGAKNVFVAHRPDDRDDPGPDAVDGKDAVVAVRMIAVEDVEMVVGLEERVREQANWTANGRAVGVLRL